MRRLHIISTIGVVLIALLCGIAIYLVLDDVTDRLTAAERRADQNSTELDAAKTTVEALNEQLRQLGEKPVVEPDDVPSDAEVVVIPGQPGPKGDRGESCIEEIGYPRCRGAEGDEGSDGVAGLDGADGAPGPKGDAGERGPQGEQGPKGDPGTAQPGTYSCAAGEYMTGFSITDAGAVVLVCQPVLGPGNPNEGARR